MATYKQIVDMVLDEIKSNTGDSDITEEHVIFLSNLYRLFLLEQKKKKDGVSSLSSANQQTICLNLERVNAIPDLGYCNGMYLRSIEEIPSLLDEDSTKVYIHDYFSIMIALVSKDRFKYVGNNKYMRNIIYSTLGADNHLYFKAVNPQFKYLKTARVTGIFEDSEKAAELACNKEDNTKCDILDQDFPLQADLIPQMIELIVRELLGVNYRPVDSYNNSQDDLSDLAAFIRKNMKSNFQKQIE